MLLKIFLSVLCTDLVSTMAADDLVTQGDKASAAIVLT